MARLTVSVLKSWLESKVSILDDKIKVVVGKIDDTPDRMIAIRHGTGRGSQMEGLFETVNYQIECRGGPNSLQDAEDISNLVDTIMLNDASNMTLGDCYILSAEWFGGGPQQLAARDADFRYSYQSGYAVTSSME